MQKKTNIKIMMFIWAERLPLIFSLVIGLLSAAVYYLVLFASMADTESALVWLLGVGLGGASIGYLAGLSVGKQVYREQQGTEPSITDGYEQSNNGD
ncbi:hypothetical protein L1285_01300 [Pseudoalteromonas sp. DL2-H2.2]|uniref:hypothetical protein n=1 Tax=Pseudoalteromonas sp. DL2-H2.2 TaxID=2908889 RepID=UPI001F29A24B|nr:hypothetical protein [Pseudoalteromonas sp. DL2-H2.2]MCF2906979.1 hypothetical protein [Pseudoalteromonas sp. DL2-H2.2]